MIFSDKAVETVEEDLLGRRKFAEKIAHDIVNWRPEDSLVIGLYARWGDGKTSVINFIKDFFKNPEKAEEKFDEENIPTVIEFNPWIFSNQGSLIQSFLMEVGKELGQSNNEVDKEIARKIALIRLYLEPARKIGHGLEIIITRILVGFFGVYLAALLNQALSNVWVSGAFLLLLVIIEGLTFSDKALAFVEGIFNRKSKLDEKTLNQLKDEIKAKLLKRNKKILFVIDDVDRLTPEEVRTLFQLIKINLDLPKVIYLVAMDVGTVSRMITRDGIDGAEYIEKIIQIPIPLPRADHKRLLAFLFKQLDEVLKFFAEDKWNQTRWTELYAAGFGEIFLKRGNLRLIKRPISQMALAAGLISTEVDPIDFLGIRTIESFYPELYEYIANNKENFVTARTHSAYEGQKMDKITKDVKAELAKVDPFIEKVLLKLFPPLESVLQNYSYGDSRESEWRQQHRICSENYFDTYFYMDVPEGELRTSEIFAATTVIGNYKEFVQLLRSKLKQNEGADLRKLLVALLDHVPKFPQDISSATNYITALLDTADDVTKIKSKGMFDFGADMEVARLIYFYLKEIRDKRGKPEVAKIATTALKRTKSVYGAVHFLSLNDPRKEKSRPENEVLTDEAAASLAEVCVQKIKKAAKSGKLKNDINLPNILYRWKEWGAPEDVQAFVNAQLKNKPALVRFISKFRAITRRSSGVVTEEIPRMQFSSLKDFIEVSAAYERLKDYKPKGLSKEDRESFELFLKDYPKRDSPDY